MTGSESECEREREKERGEREREGERERLGAVLASLKADEMRLSAVLGLKECALGPSWDVSGQS